MNGREGTVRIIRWYLYAPASTTTSILKIKLEWLATFSYNLANQSSLLQVNGSGFANGGISHQYGSSSPWIQELSPLSRSLSSPSSRPGTASSPSHSSAGLVTLLLQAREYQRVRSLFFEVASAGQAPSGGLAQGMMTACAASGAWTEAVQALRTILRGGLEGGATIQASLVTGCLQALARSAQVVGPSGQPGIANAALQIYYETQAISYDAQTYVTLIQVFATTGNPHQVVAVHELMLREGYTPDTGGALIILQSMLQLGEVGRSVDAITYWVVAHH